MRELRVYHKLRSLKLQRLREDIREGLESGPSSIFDPKEIKRTARAARAARLKNGKK